ncbi:hypothetical protein [Kribbella qitaiheensis]|uniref:hypothetical protein n=1 Tax=Kribbella qitaiheensis TaxID=1544730 RepID=UPI00162ABD73|nr:hypothetical protein [Kribbella qitaiheensis]
MSALISSRAGDVGDQVVAPAERGCSRRDQYAGDREGGDPIEGDEPATHLSSPRR